jgi:hypothetical protein
MSPSARHPAADLGAFVRQMAGFVGFDEADAEAVRRSAPLVLRHEAAITAALYDHFLARPDAARFFLQPDGSPDGERLERRKHSLGRWLRETAEAALEPGFFYGLLGMGFAHSHRSYGPGGAVPPELVVGAMSLAQTALARVFQEEIEDRAAALETSTAWNKLLLVHLSVLLLGYLQPWREEQARGGTRPA